MMKSARIFNGSGWSSRLAGSSMPYLVEIVRSASAMMGKSMVMPFSQWATTSLSQVLCESTGSTDSVATLTLRCVNHSYLSASRPISVVQTGVKSAGCEKSTHQPSPIHSWKDGQSPCVVLQEKSGTMLPRRITPARTHAFRIHPLHADGAQRTCMQRGSAHHRSSSRGRARHRRRCQRVRYSHQT